MTKIIKLCSLTAAAAMILMLNACNNNGGSGATFSVGGETTGLSDGQTVQLADGYNLNNNVTIQKNSEFTLPDKFAAGAKYSLIALTQPQNEICSVVHGEGAGINANVDNIKVVCSKDSYTVSGTVSGLLPNQTVVLMNNGNWHSGLVTMQNNQGFTFNQPVAFDGSYNVTVYKQPANQTCSVKHGDGSNVKANVGDIEVVCSTDSYSVGGTVSGLNPGQNFTIVNNGDTKHSLTIASDGKFIFNQKIAFKGDYKVKVITQPNHEGCSVVNSSGSDIESNVNNIQISCAAGYLSPIGTITTGETPDDIAVTANGKYAYVVNSIHNTISMYGINNGKLKPLSPETIQSSSGLSNIAITPNSKYVYVTNITNNTVSMYSIGNNGILSPLSPESSISVSTPSELTITPDGKYLYVVGWINGGSNIIAMYSINNDDGILRPLSTPMITSGPVSTSSMKSNNQYVYLTDLVENKVYMYGIGSEGVLSPLGSNNYVSTGTEPFGMVITPNNQNVYIANYKDNTVSMYSIMPGGFLAALQQKQTIPAGTNPEKLAVTPSGKFTYVTNVGDDSISMYQIDETSGVLQLISPIAIPTVDAPQSIIVNPDGKYVYVIGGYNSLYMYKILQ